MKCEMIDQLESVIENFCGIKEFKLSRTNDGGQKENRYISEELKKHIELSTDYVNEYLKDNKALHFYSEEEILLGAQIIDKKLKIDY